MKKENVILVDWDPGQEWNFRKYIEKKTNKKWKVEYSTANGSQKNLVFKIFNVYIKYLIFPFRIFIKRNNYGRILAWQQFFGLLLAFYCRLFKVKKYPKIIVMTFIYRPKGGLIGKIYYKFMKYIVSSKYIEKLICFSESEVEHYSKIFNLDSEKISYCLYGDREKIKYSHIKSNVSKPYFLSAGRSNRDYNFLINSLRDTNYEVCIICDKLKNEKISNIKIENNVYGEQYLEYMKNCFAIIIPLEDEIISSGQLVFLKAMEYGKPVIITKNKSVNSYIINGYNGLIIEKDKSQLIQAMELLKTNKDIYDKLSQNAIEYFNSNFTIEAFANRIAEIIS